MPTQDHATGTNRPEPALPGLDGRHRLLLIFAPYRDDGSLQWQQHALAANHGQLATRNVKLASVIGHDDGYLDGQPLDRQAIARLREQLEVEFGKFTFILLETNGKELFWSNRPVRMPDLFARLDEPAATDTPPPPSPPPPPPPPAT